MWTSCHRYRHNKEEEEGEKEEEEGEKEEEEGEKEEEEGEKDDSSQERPEEGAFRDTRRCLWRWKGGTMSGSITLLQYLGILWRSKSLQSRHVSFWAVSKRLQVHSTIIITHHCYSSSSTTIIINIWPSPWRCVCTGRLRNGQNDGLLIPIQHTVQFRLQGMLLA
jgi:hypothetical protein